MRWNLLGSRESPPSGLTGLEDLRLPGNQISDLSPLSGLTGLEVLNLRFNQIEDLEPVVDNADIGDGDSVDVRKTPLSSDALCVQIPELLDRGVDALFEEGPCP